MDYCKMLNSTYNDLVSFLQQKYGIPKYPYFKNDINWVRETRNSRTNEGLYIHHVDEDKAIMLSTKEFAINNPFDFQQPNRLVYCNMLEHLILHIKIVEYPNDLQNENEICGIGGIFNFLVPELNDIYSGIEYNQKWKKEVINQIKNEKDNYLKCIELIDKLDMCNKYNLSIFTSLNHKFNIWDIKK